MLLLVSSCVFIRSRVLGEFGCKVSNIQYELQKTGIVFLLCMVASEKMRSNEECNIY